MHHDEFIDMLREQVARFEEYWKNEHARDPQEFPMEHDEETWWEQWEAWQSFSG